MSAPSAEPRPFSPQAYAAWLVGPFALLCLGAKVHKLARAPGGDLGSALAALFADLALIGVLGALTWLALRATRGSGRAVARVALHVVVFGLTLLVFVEHGYWVATGGMLDAATLGYALSRFGELGGVFLSQMGPAVWLALAALVAVHALPAWRARAARRGFSPATIAIMAAVPLAVTGLARLTVDVAPDVAPLLGDVVVGFAGGLVSPTARATIPPGEAFAAVELGAGPRAVADGTAPDVIVVVMESVRASATSLHDPTLDTTPFLASLAARGASVDTMWTTLTHTSKALVSALCGVYPSLDVEVREAESTGLPPSCLARILRERGYDTAFMQTATGSFEQRHALADNMGFAEFVGKEDLPEGRYELANYFGWEDRALLAPALDFVERHARSERPFFLTLLNLTTHHPYATPTTFAKRRLAADDDLDAYLNSVAYLDGFLRDLFAGLERSGVLDHTLVILVGDHGQAFGEHGTRQHNTAIHEEGLHVPLVAVGPGIAPGTRIGGLRQLIDLVPTVLEWLGTPVRAGLPGLSLLSTAGHDRLFASCWLGRQCLAEREGGAKYIWYYDQRPPERFDLATDPLERESLPAGPSVPEAQAMRERLLAWRADDELQWARWFERGTRGFVSRTAPTPGRPMALRFSAPPTGTAPARPLLRLLGIDLPKQRIRSGEPISIALHYEVLGRVDGWFPLTFLLGRTKGTRPSFDGHHAVVQGSLPTSAWEPGTFVTDAFDLRPEPPLPPGTYGLVVGFFSPKVGGVADRAIIDAPEGEDLGTGGAHVDAERRAHLVTLEILPADAEDGAR